MLAGIHKKHRIAIVTAVIAAIAVGLSVWWRPIWRGRRSPRTAKTDLLWWSIYEGWESADAAKKRLEAIRRIWGPNVDTALRDPGESNVYRVLCEKFLREGDYAEASEMYDKAMEYESPDPSGEPDAWRVYLLARGGVADKLRKAQAHADVHGREYGMLVEAGLAHAEGRHADAAMVLRDNDGVADGSGSLAALCLCLIRTLSFQALDDDARAWEALAGCQLREDTLRRNLGAMVETATIWMRVASRTGHVAEARKAARTLTTYPLGHIQDVSLDNLRREVQAMLEGASKTETRPSLPLRQGRATGAVSQQAKSKGPG